MAFTTTLIPAQMDAYAGTSLRAARESPFLLILQDTITLIKMSGYLPWLFLPIQAKDPTDEFYANLNNFRDWILQGILFIIEAAVVLLGPVAYFLLPGGASILLTAIVYGGIWVITIPWQGSRVAISQMDDETALMAKEHEHERWLFINGCIVGHNGLQSNIDQLSKIFGRPVIGIHNQTYGLIADLLECLIQRAFSYSTMDTRAAYDCTKACLTDSTVKKVVLIGHSQGGIIASLAVDRLLTDLPHETFSKLEVYTFGSAASHFNNPLSLPTPCSTTPNAFSRASPPPKHIIPHIEHYVNENDMVPRWGVLHNILPSLSTRYSGTVFVRMNASGHMFCQHYLGPMFGPASSSSSRAPFLVREVEKVLSVMKEKTKNEDVCFLDQRVNIDYKLATEREFVAAEFAGIRRRRSSKASSLAEGGEEKEEEAVQFGDGEWVPTRTVVKGEERAGGEEGPVFGFVGDGSRRKTTTVREASRLWRYMGGRTPE